MRSEGFYVNFMSIPITPAGIEPATFRIVAQHLKQCATAIPPKHVETDKYTKNKLCTKMALFTRPLIRPQIIFKLYF